MFSMEWAKQITANIANSGLNSIRAISRWIWSTTDAEIIKKNDDVASDDPIETSVLLSSQVEEQGDKSASAWQVISGLGNIIFARENHASISVAALLTALNTGSNFLTYYFLSEMIETLNDESDKESSTTDLISLLIISYCASQLIPTIRDQVMNAVTMQNVGKVLELITDHLLHKSLSYHTTKNKSDHIVLLQKGFSIPTAGTPLLTQVAPTVFEVISASFILSKFCGSEVSASLLVFMSIFTLYSVYTVKPIIDAKEKTLELNNKSWEALDRTIFNYKTIHDFNQSDYMMQKSKSALADYVQAENKASRLSSGIHAGHILLARLYMFAVTVYIVQQIKAGKYPVESFVVLVGYLNQLSTLLPAFGQAVNQLCASYPDLQFIFGELANGYEIIDAHADEVLRIGPRQATIEFKDVSFSYSPKPGVAHANLFDRLSFRIESGQTIALVSESGVGKSTILNLLYRYYEPNSGEIIINGQNISSVSLSSLRKNITVFGQNPNLFKGTIRENIAYGASNPDEITDEMIKSVAIKANLLDFILKIGQKRPIVKGNGTSPQGKLGLFATEDKFEAGLNVDVGDSGDELSGGEKQKVAVLRGMLKKGHIRLLDEVTAACDAESAAQILQALKQTSNDTTTIMITHKLIEAKHAVQIFILSKDGVVARGTHHELLESNAVYQRLWQKNMHGGDEVVEPGNLQMQHRF